MKPFVSNILLAVVWAFASGEVSLASLVVGFVLGYLALGLLRPVVGQSSYFRKVGQVVGFVLFYLWEVILANLRVAYDVLTPTYHMRPGVVAIPLDAETDLEITLLANLITLTPGSLSLAVSDDRKVLYVHEMFIDDVDEVRRQIKSGYERRVLEVLR
ncbi:MAG TPA: Na+/H+ antiporter subunit E [Planctomycetaceae bacterium]|nr:Na+/H+ antiporter subunit E [Planctomycetaceae bacterium]